MSRTSFGVLLAAGLVGLFALLLIVRPPQPSQLSVTSPAVSGNPQEEMGRRWLKPSGAERDYAGDEACRSCHAREFALHSHSPHGRTVTRVSGARPEFVSKRKVEDAERGIRYSVSAVDQACEISAESPQGVSPSRPEWVLGSGTQAHTYLAANGGGFLEARISYYTRWREWGFTPGQGPAHDPDEPAGRHYSPLEAASCFGCHSTVVVGTPQALDLSHSQVNVGCEACHGPARRHVEAAVSQRGQPTDRSRLAAPRPIQGSRVIEVCGACHRLPETGPPENVEEAELARLSGVALGRSRCFRESGGRLTCTTCHDPHAPVATGPTAYDRACLGCHKAPAQTCSLGKTDRCGGCHMAAPAAGRRLPLELHNHQIRIPHSSPGASNQRSDRVRNGFRKALERDRLELPSSG